MQEFKLPSLGADMDEGTLVEWKVQPGDQVKRGDIVAVVDTSKAAIDIESWQEGTVQQLLVQPGDKFPVGTVMALLDGAANAVAGSVRPAAAVPEAGHVTAVAPTTAPVASAPPPAAGPAPTAAPAPAAAAAGTTRVLISPAARQRAAALGIDAATLKGSGMQGSITLQDVEAAAKGSAAVPAAAPAAAPVLAPAAAPASAGPARDRSAAMRLTIAAAMSRSKREIPHYYLAHTVELEKAQGWLSDWNATCPITERVLLSALLLKAVARALQQYPQLNGFYRNETFEAAPAVHTGVAIALRSGGLVAPALLDVDSKPLPALMQALNDLVQRTRAGSLRSSELSSATITVTNLGEQSVEEVFGVIYPPQVAIVGFGGVHKQLLPGGESVHAVPVLRATLAADHRVSDGQYGARFLLALATLLQDPAQLAEENRA